MLGCLAAAIFFHLSAPALAAEPVNAVHKTTSNLDDQKSVAITVYNSDLGLVREVRHIKLSAGINDLNFSDVSAKIMPQTVHLGSLTAPAGLSILEQNYEYDLLTPAKLLDKFVGRQVKVLKDGVEVPATILSTNEGVVYRLGDRILTEPPKQWIFPEIPENLISRPTLAVSLENRTVPPQDVELTYLTRGMTWKADYVALLDQDDKKLDLNGWVTLDNRSGATFKNARLKLVAGDVHRVVEEFEGMMDENVRAKKFRAAEAPAPGFSEQAFFEYHLYTLQRPTTLRDNQTKQVSLLTAGKVPVAKKFLFRGADYYYRSHIDSQASPQKVAVIVEFSNKKENGMGMPLPKGTVRVYKADHDGSLQFIGEDAIDHTPKDETIKIKLGEAFDIVAERKQTDWKKIARNVYETSFEITVRNHKEESVTVTLEEPVPGDWEMLSNSVPFKKLDAGQVQFELPVAKNGTATLQYRLRIKY